MDDDKLDLTVDQKGLMTINEAPRNRRFGVRTVAMLLCAYIWFLFGLGAFKDLAAPSPNAFHLMAPGEVRAAIWWICAGVAAVMALTRRRTAIGLGVLVVPPMLTMCSFAWSWFNAWIGGVGDPGAWYRASFYLAAVGLVMVAAFVPEPTRAHGQALLDVIKRKRP